MSCFAAQVKLELKAEAKSGGQPNFSAPIPEHMQRGPPQPQVIAQPLQGGPQVIAQPVHLQVMPANAIAHTARPTPHGTPISIPHGTPIFHTARHPPCRLARNTTNS